MSRLWYEQPAEEWEQALPLGNGRLGAMIYGGVSEECLQLNEESMWYGGRVDRNNPDAQKQLGRIRELIFAGQISEAEKLMELSMSGCPESMHPYQTLGDIRFKFEGIEEYSDYHRELNLDKAVYRQSFRSKNTLHRREIFISRPADVMIMHFTSEGEKTMSFCANLRRERFYDGVKKAGTRGICLYGNLGKGGFDFSMMLTALSRDGSITVMGENLLVQDATEVTLYFCADTSYHVAEAMLEPSISDRIQRAYKLDFKELLKEHEKDYASLYEKVEFSLEGMEEFEEVPTDKRMLKAKKKPDKGLAALLFDYGRYLLISCSRQRGLPATLQGLWNKDMCPPWESKYTVNINTQMNYWMAESCNLSECHMPLFELIKTMVPNGRKTARRMYGCRGFVCHHNTDIHGDTAVQDRWIPGSYWVMGAAWLCTHQWMHYEYTLDEDFLRESFPIMREAAEFFLDFLVEHEGYLVTCPSVSPENTFVLPSGEKGSNIYGVTMDNQILRDLFTQCIEAAQILGVEDELNEKIKGARERLIPTQIGENGTIMEWPKEYKEYEPGHRHISHLYGLHPSDQITVDGTPELAKAARATLERRLSFGGGHTGWSRAWIINHYARLWDGEKAYENIEKLIADSTYLNLFDRHPPFQIDGNFGMAAAVAEMLVQSSMERIVLLPALPKAWKTGSIKGLRVRGAASVSIFWKNGRLEECIVSSDKGMVTYIRYQETVTLFKWAAGEEKRLTWNQSKKVFVED